MKYLGDVFVVIFFVQFDYTQKQTMMCIYLRFLFFLISVHIHKTDYIIESKKKREFNITIEKQSFNVDLIIKVYNKLLNYKFEDYELKILKYLNIDNKHSVLYAYILDRLSYHEKLILGYSVMLFIKDIILSVFIGSNPVVGSS